MISQKSPKKAIRAVTASPTTASNSDMDNDQPVVHVIHAIGNRRLPTCQVVLHYQPVSALIDTRVSINLMAEDVYQRLTDPPPLRPTLAQVNAFANRHPVDIAGIFTMDVTNDSTKMTTKIYVSEEVTGFLLNCRAAQSLNLYTSYSVFTPAVWETL
ncbi:hypothetical protein NDU88_005175 [Pleurodeles waltl]|uniref:Uncharacterized protein n=1 Tax=Pleurodeles waltl TaxID=8319 RepID=A0AAV7TU32_PLEWA|nr:hypothetical protein NDU88_005175 [Pleurodeles waltl]